MYSMRRSRNPEAKLTYRLLTVLAVSLVATSATLVGHSPPLVSTASANTSGGSCFQQPHVMDIACVNGKNGDTYHGAADGWDARSLYVNCSDSRVTTNKWHANNSMWTFTSTNDNPGKNGMEMGLWNGYSVWDPTCNSSSTQGQVYFYNFDSNGSLTDGRYGYVSLNNSNHTTEVDRDPANNSYWYERYDGNIVWHATGQNSSTMYEDAVGLELAENSGALDLTWATFPTVHNTLTVMNTSDQWNSWSYFNTYRNQPCGGSYSSGDCTNGSWPWQAEWDVNRG
jgi:hypothetical protein